MRLHIVSLLTVSIAILSGLTASSSNITSKLSFGLRKALGMWYLIQATILKWTEEKEIMKATIVVFHLISRPADWTSRARERVIQ